MQKYRDLYQNLCLNDIFPPAYLQGIYLLETSFVRVNGHGKCLWHVQCHLDVLNDNICIILPDPVWR